MDSSAYHVLDPAAVLAELNKELLKDKVGKYIALFYAVLDTQTARIDLCQCRGFSLAFAAATTGATTAALSGIKKYPCGHV